jgi:hypothetical protein
MICLILRERSELVNAQAQLLRHKCRSMRHLEKLMAVYSRGPCSERTLKTSLVTTPKLCHANLSKTYPRRIS